VVIIIVVLICVCCLTIVAVCIGCTIRCYFKNKRKENYAIMVEDVSGIQPVNREVSVEESTSTTKVNKAEDYNELIPEEVFKDPTTL